MMDEKRIHELAKQPYPDTFSGTPEEYEVARTVHALRTAINEALSEVIAIVPKHVSPAMALDCQAAIEALKLP